MDDGKFVRFNIQSYMYTSNLALDSQIMPLNWTSHGNQQVSAPTMLIIFDVVCS